MQKLFLVVEKSWGWRKSAHLFISKFKKKSSDKNSNFLIYSEILLNENATFNDDGTMTYNPKRICVFDRELSIADQSTERIIVPNLPLLVI